MSILTGQEIINQIYNHHIRIGNLNLNNVQPNSYDVTLGNKISFYALTDNAIKVGQMSKDATFESFGMLALEDPSDTDRCNYIRGIPYLDTKTENTMLVKDIPVDGYILLPRILYLVETVESVWSDKYVAEISGTSSLARLGITVHKTAGYANIGHEFKWILEVEVSHPVKIYPGMKIGQMYFHTAIGETTLQYQGKYKNAQMGNELCGSLNHIDTKGGSV